MRYVSTVHSGTLIIVNTITVPSFTLCQDSKDWGQDGDEQAKGSQTNHLWVIVVNDDKDDGDCFHLRLRCLWRWPCHWDDGDAHDGHGGVVFKEHDDKRVKIKLTMAMEIGCSMESRTGAAIAPWTFSTTNLQAKRGGEGDEIIWCDMWYGCRQQLLQNENALQI